MTTRVDMLGSLETPFMAYYIFSFQKYLEQFSKNAFDVVVKLKFYVGPQSGTYISNVF